VDKDRAVGGDMRWKSVMFTDEGTQQETLCRWQCQLQTLSSSTSTL